MLLLSRSKEVSIGYYHSSYAACNSGIIVCILYHFTKAVLQYYTDIYSLNLEMFRANSDQTLSALFTGGFSVLSWLVVSLSLFYFAALLLWSALLFVFIKLLHNQARFSHIFRICAYSGVAMLPALVPVIGIFIYWYFGLVLPARLICNLYTISYRKVLFIVFCLNLFPILLSIFLPIPIGATFPFYY
jgi:hypothetical protein